MTRQFRFFALVSMLLTGCLAGVQSPAGAATGRPGAAARRAHATVAADPRRVLLEAMATEQARALAKLKIADNQPPYFIAYAMRDEETAQVEARYGAILWDDTRRNRSVRVEVRVGSYAFDNGSVKQRGFFGMNDDRATYQVPLGAPIEDDAMALRGVLWLATDQAYKKALADYLSKRGDRVYDPDDDQAPSFAKEPPHQAIDPPRPMRFDRAGWRRELRRASRRFRRAPEILDNDISVDVRHVTRTIVNSEGTRLIQESLLYSLTIQTMARAEDGMLIRHDRAFYGRSEDELPKGARLEAAVDALMDETLALREAPVMDPYTGPALLEAQATGVLFHEALGHRLEGERQDDKNEGQTFQGQVGRRILVPFLDVFDDPTLERWGKTPLNGFYRFDDEGVPAQRAVLVEQGILRGYLLSRSPVKGVPPRSNGHGRTEGRADPMGRMANLVVAPSPGVARQGKEILSRAALEERLLEVARAQGKPYALIIADVDAGDTNTSGYGYQAFRGVPTLLYRVDVKTGKKTLVRGAELVGTPLTVINKIAAVSNERGVFNGYCGAESGYVPVATVAPAVLITEIELQRQRKESERAPVLPPPWASGASSSAGGG